MTEPKKAAPDAARFLTGSDLLDVMVGGGMGAGYLPGKIINLVGDKSAGKTFLACEIVASAYHRYGDQVEWDYDDCESGFTFNTKAMYGVQIMPDKVEDRRRSRTVEELYCNIRDFTEGLPAGKMGIYIVDSLDGLTSEEMDARADKRFNKFKKGDEKPMEGSYQMGKAKFMSQEFFPQLAELVENKRVLVVIISQIRENVDVFSFEKFKRGGGKALDFYCHSVIWLAMKHKIKRRDRVVGILVRARLTKSKTPRPFRECEFSLLFDYGLDNVGSNVDYLFDLRGDSGVLLDAANAVVWEGEPMNVARLKKYLGDNGLVEAYRAEGYKEFKKSDMIKWLSAGDRREKFEAFFGTAMTRDELIQYIEDKELRGKLTERVVAKWEQIEESVRTNRRPKYSR